MAPFTNCISEISNTQTVNSNYINVVISMYNLKEYSNNYSKTSGSINAGAPINFPGTKDNRFNRG